MSALLEDATVAIASEAARTVFCAGDIVFAIVVEVENIVGETVGIFVAEAAVEIIDPVAIGVDKQLVFAVAILIDKAKAVRIRFGTDVVDPVAVGVAEAVVDAIAIPIDIANEGGRRGVLLCVGAVHAQDHNGEKWQHGGRSP